jgi:hypothetical protein
MPLDAPSRGLSLGHGSARLEAFSINAKVRTNPFDKLPRRSGASPHQRWPSGARPYRSHTTNGRQNL